MTQLCVWLSDDLQSLRPTVRAMASALRVNTGQIFSEWYGDGIGIGVLDLPGPNGAALAAGPTQSQDVAICRWFVGEVFSGGLSGFDLGSYSLGKMEGRESQRRALNGPAVEGARMAQSIDGEFLILEWDRATKCLRLWNDLFGSLQVYWGTTSSGAAIATGVRGVLAAPGFSAEPDPEAIREAVTFGGYRLGERTNVRGVRMLKGGHCLRANSGEVSVSAHLSWAEFAASDELVDSREAVERAASLWEGAIAARLRGADRIGLTLSGGLDSRAILAEATRQGVVPVTVTYGLAGCDDERYAGQAARRAGVPSFFVPLYNGGRADWLDARSRWIQPTDGLIDFVDLMHLETLEVQRAVMAVHLSGYIGDFIAGDTYLDAFDVDSALRCCPYYRYPLGLPVADARERLLATARDLDLPAARFLLFVNKLQQSTNRWGAAYRDFFRVRRPFTDRALFAHFQRVPRQDRVGFGIYPQMLLRKYPALFESVPWQKTGMPIGTPSWRLQAVRGVRFARRRFLLPLARSIGIELPPRIRAYTADWEMTRMPPVEARIRETILRPGSIVAGVFGAPALRAALDAWFQRGSVPAQVIASLYVYEAYHRDLGDFLRTARGRSLSTCGAPEGKTE